MLPSLLYFCLITEPDKNNSYIKATEKTVTSRLPARIEIRKHAELEMPHIMMLIDDKKGEIIEKLYADKQDMQVVQSTLNKNNGIKLIKHIAIQII